MKKNLTQDQRQITKLVLKTFCRQVRKRKVQKLVLLPYFVLASNRIILTSHMPSETSAMTGSILFVWDSKVSKTLLPYLHGTVLHVQIPK